MKKQSKILILILTLSMVLIMLVGCSQPAVPQETGNETPSSNEPAPPVPEGPKEMVVGFYQEPESIHPFIGAPTIYSWVRDPVYDTLIQVDDSSATFAPMVAESWDLAEDSVTFHIRKGIKFHDGSDLTGADVLYCIEWAANPDNGSLTAGRLATFFESAELVDEYTVRVNSKMPYAHLLTVFVDLYIAPKDSADTQIDNPIGSGPFKYVNWERNVSIQFERFSEYWNADAISLDKLTFRFFGDENAMLTALLAGEIQGVNQINNVNATMVDGKSGFHTVGAPSALTFYAVSQKGPVLNNPLVCQAIKYAINPEELMLTSGSSGPVAIFPFSNESVYYDPNCEWTQDVEKSKKLLAEAGYQDGLELTILSDNVIYPQCAEAMQNMLSKVGITAKIEALEYTVYIERWIAGDFDLCINGFNRQLDPTQAFGRFVSTAANNVITSYNNPEYDKLYNEAIVTLDEASRASLYKQAFNILINEDAVCQGLFWTPVSVGLSDNVDKVRITLARIQWRYCTIG